MLSTSDFPSAWRDMKQVTNAAYGLLRKGHLSFFLFIFLFLILTFPFIFNFFIFSFPNYFLFLFLIFHFSLPFPLPESFLFLIFPFLFSAAHQAKASHFYYHFSFHCFFVISPLQILNKYTHPHIFLGKRKEFLQDFYYLCTRMLLLCTIKSVGRD